MLARIEFNNRSSPTYMCFPYQLEETHGSIYLKGSQSVWKRLYVVLPTNLCPFIAFLFSSLVHLTWNWTVSLDTGNVDFKGYSSGLTNKGWKQIRFFFSLILTESNYSSLASWNLDLKFLNDSEWGQQCSMTSSLPVPSGFIGCWRHCTRVKWLDWN